jgi:hypothetical protein
VRRSGGGHKYVIHPSEESHVRNFEKQPQLGEASDATEKRAGGVHWERTCPERALAASAARRDSGEYSAVDEYSRTLFPLSRAR